MRNVLKEISCTEYILQVIMNRTGQKNRLDSVGSYPVDRSGIWLFLEKHHHFHLESPR